MTMRSLKLLPHAILLAAGAAWAQPQPSPRPAALCATADQAKQVVEYYKTAPGMLPPNAARALKLPEAVVVSGLPKDQVAVVSGAEFIKIWDTLTAWPDALALIMKGGHVFEITGKIKPGEASARSNFYNIAYGGGLGGHLRPDLVSTIAVFAIPGKEGAVMRGVQFYDGSGEAGFGVFVPGGEGGKPSPEIVAAFEKTLAAAKSLRPACG